MPKVSGACRAKWTAPVVLLLLTLYPLSIGPAYRMMFRFAVSGHPQWTKPLCIYCWPMEQVARIRLIGEPLAVYLNWCFDAKVFYYFNDGSQSGIAFGPPIDH